MSRSYPRRVGAWAALEILVNTLRCHFLLLLGPCLYRRHVDGKLDPVRIDGGVSCLVYRAITMPFMGWVIILPF